MRRYIHCPRCGRKQPPDVSIQAKIYDGFEETSKTLKVCWECADEFHTLYTQFIEGKPA